MIKSIYKHVSRWKEYFKYNFSIRYNKMILMLNNVAFEKGIGIVGKMYVYNEGKICIGENFFMSGGTYNPLSNNRISSICVRLNAQLSIGKNCGFSSPTIDVRQEVVIGNNVNLGANTVILDSNCHSLNFLDRRNPTSDIINMKSEKIVIGNDVLVGTNSIILKGVTLGDRVVVGANSVVTKSVPDDCIVAGNPARIIRWNN